jgi:2-dehydro-3-deoxyphosphogluconate aldolase/(4S)-4-hydroxy-2-oxoglutarate aldolase
MTENPLDEARTVHSAEAQDTRAARDARFVEMLAERRVVAIVRGRDADAALRTVITLFEEGIDLVEVSLVTANALDVIRQARAALGNSAELGAGTVLTTGDATAAEEAGASFLVTPAVTEAVSYGRLPVLAGAFTPTEVVAALNAGATAIKLFPAFQGGEKYLRALRDPFPSVPFVPVGGVSTDAAVEYLRAGAVAVGVGSPLVGDAADGGSLDALKERIRAFKGLL